MMNRRTFLAAAAGLALPLPARAVALVPFAAGAFKQAQAEGRPILIHATAPWCGTCRAQKRVLRDLLGPAEMSAFLWLEVDFDTQPDIRHAFDVRHPSMLVVFGDGEEVARAVGATWPEALRELLSRAP